jgi:hypothetical protein
MQNKLVLSTLALALAGFAFTACGGSSGDDTASGPDITAASATATDNGDGTFNIDIQTTFDDDADVSSFTLDCTNGADSADDFDIPNANDNGVISPAAAAGTIDISVTGLTDTETGTFSCNFALIDDNDLTSATFQFNFDLN